MNKLPTILVVKSGASQYQNIHFHLRVDGSLSYCWSAFPTKNNLCQTISDVSDLRVQLLNAASAATAYLDELLAEDHDSAFKQTTEDMRTMSQEMTNESF